MSKEWLSTSIGEIAQIYDGPHATPAKTDEGPWYLSISSLVDGRLDLSHSAHISEEDFSEWTRRIKPEAGDVVFSYETRLGEAALVSEGLRCALGRRMGLLRSNRNWVDPQYLVYAYLGPEFQNVIRVHTSHGGTVNRILLTEMGNFPIRLPPLPEQRKITEILGTWDNAIALAERCIKVALHRNKGLMQRLLSGRLRFPEFIKSSKRFDSSFGSLPLDWQVEPLGSLVEAITRPEKVQSSKEYQMLGVRWYNAGAHIHSIRFGENIRTETLSRIKTHDIVYNKMWATKAAFAVAKPEHADAYGTSEYPQFLANEGVLRIDFLENVFHLPRFQYDATALCHGTTGRARLNPKDFLRIEIPLPSIEEQEKIAAVLRACERKIDLLMKKRDGLQRQKKGLMQQLLTGWVRVIA